jgi:ubiquinone/menaquinone biosynthesis C-methylase UbiE
MNNSHSEHTGLIPWFNAWIMHRVEKRYNQLTDKRKRSLFSNLTGRVLEIGPGTGANLNYYPDNISLTALEPNPHMQSYLKEKAQALGRSIEVITGQAEAIPLKDESVNTVVSTLVLCSVTDLQRTLSEIKRVLKPGGTFLFIEHVAAPSDAALRTIQRWIKPLWKRMADGCHPDRETWKAIETAGFAEVKMDHFRLSLPVVSPQIMGRAMKQKKL